MLVVVQVEIFQFNLKKPGLMMCETVALLLVLVNSTSFGSANRATYIEAGLLRTRLPYLHLLT